MPTQVVLNPESVNHYPATEGHVSVIGGPVVILEGDKPTFRDKPGAQKLGDEPFTVFAVASARLTFYEPGEDFPDDVKPKRKSSSRKRSSSKARKRTSSAKKTSSGKSTSK